MRLARAVLALSLAAAAALALAPRLLAPDPEAWLEEQAAGWSAGQAPPAALAMREQNPEWDLMSRTFLGFALADRALAEPADRERHLATLDALIADTLAQEAASGHSWYLLPYAHAQPFRGGGRSLFVDGEILALLGARRLVQDDRWGPEMQERARIVAASFGAAGPLPLAESYPDEGWLFCHSLAMLGLRMHEVLDGADHGALRAAWLGAARGRLVHAPTGLLVSEFTLDGQPLDGPEGSSIWMVAVALRALDPGLARAQYDLAKEHLAGSFLGYGYAKEWPEGFENGEDIDSGPIVPVLGASASSSGFALAASRAFGDEGWHDQLRAALGAASAIMQVDPALAEAADNPVGQAVVAWGLGFGPLWERLGPPPGEIAGI